MDYLEIRYAYNSLSHSGIKGMKWGVRRYENEDGTLTESGKARYNEDKTPKNSKDMTNEDLRNSSSRLAAENQYDQLAGRSQPGHSLNRDTAIKVGASFLASAGASFLFRKLRTGKWLEGKSTDSEKRRVGKSIITALFVGGAGALIAGASSVGGNIYQQNSSKGKDSGGSK